MTSLPTRKKNRPLCRIEVLEDRIAPAVTATYIPGSMQLNVVDDGVGSGHTITFDADPVTPANIGVFVDGSAVSIAITGGPATFANVTNVTFQHGVSAFVDVVTIDPGNDTAGFDTIGASFNAGAGGDTLDASSVGTAQVILTGGAGADTLKGGGGNDMFAGGGVGADVVSGGAGSNQLTGANVANTWNITGANAGNINGAGSFTNIQNLTGGTGNDTFVFANAGTLAGNSRRY